VSKRFKRGQTKTYLDNNKIAHNPREWFIAPLDVIDEAIELIVSGKIIEYRYDYDKEIIIYTTP